MTTSHPGSEHLPPAARRRRPAPSIRLTPGGGREGRKRNETTCGERSPEEFEMRLTLGTQRRIACELPHRFAVNQFTPSAMRKVGWDALSLSPLPCSSYSRAAP